MKKKKETKPEGLVVIEEIMLDLYATEDTEYGRDSYKVGNLEEVAKALFDSQKNYEAIIEHITEEIFKWQQKHNITSICSKHQTPNSNCSICDAMINELKKKANKVSKDLTVSDVEVAFKKYNKRFPSEVLKELRKIENKAEIV